MKRLLKADFYHLRKSRLTLIALILAVAFPLLTVLLFSGIRAIGELDGNEAGDLLLNANYVIGSVFSFTNNLGLVIPVFAGIIVCLDYSNGTLRNKVIAGNRRSSVYLSHLIVSMLFCVGVIVLYAILTVALALIFFPFHWDPSLNLGTEVLYFVLYGIMSFAFIATVSTMLALIFRSIAPTIIVTILFSMVLLIFNSVIMLIDYEPIRYIVYLIPTFGANFFNLNDFNILGILSQTTDASRGVIFAEGMLSYLFFGTIHTLIGLLVFRKRDLR